MAKKYIDAELLRKEAKRLEKAAHKSALGCADSETRKFLEGKDFAYQHVGILIDSLQQQTDGILNSYIEQRSKELDAIIQEEMTPDNTVTIADKIGAMTAKNELLRIKELI